MNEELKNINLKQKTFVKSHNFSYEFRKNQLKKLLETFINYEKKFLDALKADLNKSSYESYMCEIGAIKSEFRFHIKNLKKWMRPKKVKKSLVQFGYKNMIYSQGYGTCLIIVPWNYPLLLLFQPLIGAISAGNVVTIKLSKETSALNDVLKDFFSFFEDEIIYFVDNDKIQNEDLFDSVFYDFIFFTGSSMVGKKIMQEASKNLTPVVLELGGKSPCIVDEVCNLENAIKSIVFGKLLNAGQTCVAPDYILVHKKHVETFKEKLIKHLIDQDINKENFSHIINEKHLDRLKSYFDEKLCYGGKTIERYMEPTILDDVFFDDKIMQEEIFGPIFPIIYFENFDELIKELKKYDRPLAAYLFSEDKKHIKEFCENYKFGGGCINDTIFHMVGHHAPFGGIGKSGIGRYHGYYSFECFSHFKTISKKSFFDPSLRYRPYTNIKEKLMRFFLKI